MCKTIFSKGSKLIFFGEKHPEESETRQAWVSFGLAAVCQYCKRISKLNESKGAAGQ